MTVREPFLNPHSVSNVYAVKIAGVETKIEATWDQLQEINKYLAKEVSRPLEELVEAMESEPCSVSLYGDVKSAYAAQSAIQRCIEIVKSRAEWGRGKE